MPLPIRLGAQLPRFGKGPSYYDRLSGFLPGPIAFEGGMPGPGKPMPQPMQLPQQPGMDRFSMLQMLLRKRGVMPRFGASPRQY